MVVVATRLVSCRRRRLRHRVRPLRRAIRVVVFGRQSRRLRRHHCSLNFPRRVARTFLLMSRRCGMPTSHDTSSSSSSTSLTLLLGCNVVRLSRSSILRHFTIRWRSRRVVHTAGSRRRRRGVRERAVRVRTLRTVSTHHLLFLLLFHNSCIIRRSRRLVHYRRRISALWSCQ